jgi:D-glycero-alpha-D-manno-heptose-7-phosphate kinase
MAVTPSVEVQIFVNKNRDTRPVTVHLDNYGRTYSYPPEPGHNVCEEDILINAVIDTIGIPDDVSVRVNIYSSVPPGASTGTSAAVSVALIGALDALQSKTRSAHDTAMLAHRIETEKLGRQCGIQDQLASALGGINYIAMHDFPHSKVFRISLQEEILREIENRLVLVYIGSPHDSSMIHERIIADLGTHARTDHRIISLRKLAEESRSSLISGDLRRFGQIMDRNTELQRKLHPDLVCAQFENIIEIARRYRSLGAKVNGAGGDGGSVTILTDGDDQRKRELIIALENNGYEHIPIHLSHHGLTVWCA